MRVDILPEQEDIVPEAGDSWRVVFWWARRGERGLDRTGRWFRHHVLNTSLPEVARWTLR